MDEEGDYFNIFLATKVPIVEIAPDSVILCPMFRTGEETMNSSSLAYGPMMYVKFLGPR
jgi:hypothetical protein